ncbi:hypothetical protein [Microbacterium indicum]|uniref:hypothetical protein n=1 Tax=Microbacterium indicum TaxID=358100 RepID=UPI000417695A|nr:hypothetical protein [Microbacterium indicum]
MSSSDDQPTVPLPDPDRQPTEAYPRPTEPYPAAAVPPLPPQRVVPTQPAQRPRPGAGLATTALILAIAGFVFALLGFASGIAMALGYLSFLAWPLFVTAIVLAIIALVRRARGTGMSIAALAVSVVGGIVGVFSVFVVLIAGIAGVAQEFGEDLDGLLPSESPSDGWPFEEPTPEGGSTPAPESTPEAGGSSDAAVQADCATLIAEPQPDTGDAAAVEAYFDDLAAQMQTEEVAGPLEDIADVIESVYDLDDPTAAADAIVQVQAAGQQLAASCGFEIPTF